MTPAESLILTRFVRAACPQQKFDEYTPDAWHELLRDLSLENCRAAVTALGKRQTFISPAEIRGEVNRIRADRIRRFGNSEPDYDGADVIGGLEAIRAQRRAIADGEITEPPKPEITAGPYRDDVARLVRDTAQQLPKIPRADESA
jgi:hypothetical protein